MPDGGRIVHIPEDWPKREKVGDFPFQIGDEVHIVSEPYDNVYCIARNDGDYLMEIHVPKETVEVLAFAGERTVRYDVKKLRWTINGMTADVSDFYPVNLTVRRS